MTVFNWNGKTYDTAYLSTVQYAYLTPTLSGAGNTSPWIFAAFEDALVETGLRVSGGAGGYLYAFSASVAGTDPGPGSIAFNTATLSAATSAVVDILQTGGGDVSAWLAAMVSANAIKGDLTIRSLTTNTKFASWTITSVTNNTGFYSLGLGAYTGPTPAPTFTAGEALAVTFVRAGAAGTVTAAGDGTPAAPGIAFTNGGGFYRQGAGVIRVSNGAADLLSLIPATQADAQAGTDTLKLMTSQRTRDAIIAQAGGGGQTATGDLVLTNATMGAIVVTPSGPGFFATLPNATTRAVGAGAAEIYNAGEYDYGIRDSAGNRLGWVPARMGCSIGLADSSTAAGIWTLVGADRLGVVASFRNGTTANIGATRQVIDIGSSRYLILTTGTTSAGDLYGVIYDGAARSWGALTLIRSSLNGYFTGILSAANQVLVCSSNTSTGFQTVVLSISGTTITVNTAVNTTLALNCGSVRQLIQVGSSYVVAYTNSTPANCLRAITISGTTPTVGAETIISLPSISLSCRLYASGSVLRTIAGSTTTVQATPYTVSGTTLTIGTLATTGANSAETDTNLRTFVNSNGNIVAEYVNTTHFTSVFKLTGTVEAVSSVSIGAVPGSSISNGYADMLDIGAGKTLFAWYVSGPSIQCNILTDTAGTASAGTALTFQGNAQYLAALIVSSNLARVVTATSSTVTQYVLSVSGSSPTVSSLQYTVHPVSAQPTTASDYLGRRSANLLRAGTTAYAFPVGSVGTPVALQSTPASLYQISRPRAGAQSPIAGGTNDNQSWFGRFQDVNSIGDTFELVECAA